MAPEETGAAGNQKEAEGGCSIVGLPEFESRAGIYSLVFANGIKIQLERLKEHSDNVSGEVTVTCTLPGVLPHLHQARLNLTSTAARNTLAKHLSTRLRDETIDWDAMVEQACVMTLRSYREGEPLILVGSMPPSDEPKYLLEPLLLRDQANLIYGPGGVGKSYLATFVGLCVLSGMGLSNLVPSQGEVLYLDYETSPEELDARVQSLRHMFPDFKEDLNYRFCHQPLVNEIDQLLKLAIGIDARLIIVDSVGAACGGEPESAEVVLKYFMALRAFRCTTLSLDHVAKNVQEKTPFGSVYKYNSARNIFEIKKAQEVGEDTLYLGLYHRKANMGKLMKPLGYSLSFDNQTATFATTELRDVPELAAGMPLRDQIRDILRRGALSVAEIADEISSTEATIRKILSRYKDVFIRTENGWGLLSKSTGNE